MKKSDVVFKKLKRLFAFGAAVLCLASCSVLSTSSSAPKLPGDGTQCAVGGVLHNAEFSARTAIPTTPTNLTYKVSATNGSVTKTGTVDTSGAQPTFSILLPFGEWTFTAEALDSSNKIVLSDSQTITLNESSQNIDFSLKYIQDSAVKGNADLTIAYPTTAGISKIEYSLAKSAASRTTITDVSSGTLKIEQDLAPGAYNLIVYFYDASNAPIYRIDQIVNIYSNLTTSKFEGTAPYISGGNISISSTEINKFQITEFYVGGTNGDDGNTGTAFDPFASVQKAINKIKTINNGSTEYKIYVRGTVQAATTEPVASFSSFAGTGATVKIIGNSADATLKGNGDNVVYVSTGEDKLTLTLQDLILTGGNAISGGGIYAGSGDITVQNCKITGNETTSLGLGAGIYINNDAKLTITDTLISNNTSANNGGGIYNAGTLTLTSDTGITEFSGNSATKGKGIFNNGTLKISKNVKFNSDDIYLNKDASNNLKAITIEENLTQDKVARITPTETEYENGKTVLEDNSSGTLVAANYTKFEVTPENRSGDEIGWEIESNGNLKEGERLIKTVYLNSVNGDDSNTGSESAPVKTLKKARKILDTTKDVPTIIIMKPYTIPTDENNVLDFSSCSKQVTIQRYCSDDKSAYCSGNMLTINGTTSTIEKVIFEGNKSNIPTNTDVESLLYIKTPSTVSINADTIFQNNNNTKTSGGAIFNEQGATLTITDVTIKDNDASVISDNNGYGGGIYNKGVLIVDGESLIENNTSKRSGGGIANRYGTSTEIKSGTIQGNTSGTNGGGITNEFSKLTLSGGLITGNSADLGKGIYHNGNTGNTLNMSGKVQVADNNDICLASSKFITITGAFDSTITTVAYIKLPLASSYTPDTKILSAASDDLITDNYSKFNLLNSDGTPCTEYSIKPNGTTAVLTLNSTFYVDGSSGNNDNSGLSESKALKTVQAAIDKIAAVNDGETQFTINVSGTIAASTDGTVANFSAAKLANATVAIIGPSASSKAVLQGNKDGSGDKNSVVLVPDTVKGVSLKLQNLAITKGKTTENGGGVQMNAGSLTVENCEINENSSMDNTEENKSGGGGIYINGGTTGTAIECSIKGCTISGNNADNKGGGICIQGKVNLTIENSTIESNTTETKGGGIYNGYSSQVIIKGGSISGNTAANGGGIYVNAGTDGGVSKAGKLTIQKDGDEATTIVNNSATGSSGDGNGGGVYIAGGESTITDAVIGDASSSITSVPTGATGEKSNTANNGAGIFITGTSTLSLLGKTYISYNKGTGTSHGGGIDVHDGATLNVGENVCIQYNSATYGGGLSIYGENTDSDNPSKLTFNGIVQNNQANMSGGGMFLGNADVIINSKAKVTLNENISTGTNSYGGGIHITDNNNAKESKLLLNGGEISQNKTGGKGGAISVFKGALTIAGEVLIPYEETKKNDIFLNDKAIILTSDFAIKNSEKIRITPKNYKTTTTVLSATSGDTTTVSAKYGNFTVTPDGATEWSIGTDGKLKKNAFSSGIAIEIPGLTGYTFEISNTTPTYGEQITLTVKKGSDAITADSYAMKLYNADDLEFLNPLATSENNKLTIPGSSTLSLYPNKKYKLLLFATIDGIARESTAELTIE